MGKRNFFVCIGVVFGAQVVVFLPLLLALRERLSFLTTPVIAGMFAVMVLVDIFAIALSFTASDNWTLLEGDSNGKTH